MSFTQQVYNKRNQLKRSMDEFTTFAWGTPSEGFSDSFDEFGIFIVGGKDALKFYNGPGFSNKYVSTQFQAAKTTLQSVEFKTMTVSFTMGVYWFTIEEYRKLLLKLHPYEINTLSFSFAPEWYYLAKLSGISDSTRYFLGRDENGESRYYTEIKLTFEVQGEACLHNFDNLTIGQISATTPSTGQNISTITMGFSNTIAAKSDLDTPFEITFAMQPTGATQALSSISTISSSAITDTDVTEKGYYLSLTVLINTNNTNGKNITNEYPLFEAFLKNLSWNNIAGKELSFSYDSSQGFLFIGADELLSAQTTLYSGKRILEALSIKSFKLPGELESGLSSLDFQNIQFKLYYSTNWTPIFNIDNKIAVDFIAHARTNVI